MEKIHQIDENTRIKLKFHFPALGTVLALQRKGPIFWRTTSWIYPSCLTRPTLECAKSYLFWDERNSVSGIDTRIGLEILNDND